MTSTSPANAPMRSQYGSPIRPEEQRECDSDCGDQDQLASDEGAEPEVDQAPGVADQLSLRLRE
jgi:hypothetical protein